MTDPSTKNPSSATPTTKRPRATAAPKPRSPKAEAADPATAPERLAELAAQAVKLARVVAKNAAAPEALLAELSHSADAATRRALVTNPATPCTSCKKLPGSFPNSCWRTQRWMCFCWRIRPSSAICPRRCCGRW